MNTLESRGGRAIETTISKERRGKRIVATCAAGALAIGLAGCGSSESARGEAPQSTSVEVSESQAIESSTSKVELKPQPVKTPEVESRPDHTMSAIVDYASFENLPEDDPQEVSKRIYDFFDANGVDNLVSLYGFTPQELLDNFNQKLLLARDVFADESDPRNQEIGTLLLGSIVADRPDAIFDESHSAKRLFTEDMYELIDPSFPGSQVDKPYFTLDTATTWGGGYFSPAPGKRDVARSMFAVGATGTDSEGDEANLILIFQKDKSSSLVSNTGYYDEWDSVQLVGISDSANTTLDVVTFTHGNPTYNELHPVVDGSKF